MAGYGGPFLFGLLAGGLLGRQCVRLGSDNLGCFLRRPGLELYVLGQRFQKQHERGGSAMSTEAEKRAVKKYQATRDNIMIRISKEDGAWCGGQGRAGAYGTRKVNRGSRC